MGKHYLYAMATVKYLIRSKDDSSNIYVRLRDGRGIDITRNTSLTINSDFWSTQKGWIRNKAQFTEKAIYETELRKLRDLIFQQRNTSLTKEVQINGQWLEKVIAIWKGEHTESSNGLVEWTSYYIDFLPNKIINGQKGATNGTIKSYKVTLKRLLSYQSRLKKQIKLSELNLTFHQDFMDFCETELKLAPNSIGKSIRQIKTVANYAKDHGEKVHADLSSRNFNIPSEKSLFITLTEEDIQQISIVDGSNYLTNARDWLIIGCWTGCRVGDLMELNMENIKESDGKKILQYTQKKTNQLVSVPIHNMVNDILIQRNGFPRPISDVKFNRYIKEVARNAGLNEKVYGSRKNPEIKRKEKGYFEKWQLVTSHICRRSFATIHFPKLPNKIIMQVTGHRSEKVFLDYIGETEIDHLASFHEVWEQ